MQHTEPVRRKKAIYSGESWGVRDAVSSQWHTKPDSLNSQHTHTQALEAERRVGQGRAHVPRSRNMGVYNPIQNTWTVPPDNPRILEGLSYHPRGLFKTYGRV